MRHRFTRVSLFPRVILRRLSLLRLSSSRASSAWSRRFPPNTPICRNPRKPSSSSSPSAYLNGGKAESEHRAKGFLVLRRHSSRSVQKMSPEKPSVYHERQRLQFCLLHSLNNLFQRKDAFTRESLNLIAERLVQDDPNKETWTPLSLLFKPHHNALTGNYDINVLIAALEGEGKRVVWHDHRSGATAIDLEGSDGKLMGLVLNVPVRRYAGLWQSRHWVAIRTVEGVWYNLDSDLAVPYAFQDIEGVREFLDSVIANGGEVLLVLNDDH